MTLPQCHVIRFFVAEVIHVADCVVCRRIYLAYMDSVHFFKPRQFRTAVYHEILIGYLDYVKLHG